MTGSLPQQSPAPGSALLRFVGDSLTVQARFSAVRPGRMVLRLNRPAWRDVPMQPCGKDLWQTTLALLEVGTIEAKVCFLPRGGGEPLWPEGGNLLVKVAPAHTAAANTVYAAFTRQFGASLPEAHAQNAHAQAVKELDEAGYAVIPPSGTFRSLARHLDFICGELGFRTLLLLPVHPTPTTFARMGRYGSPFAGLDFLAIDPALAEFDTHATPLDQFRELIGAAHARGATLFMDIPANHTGWASTFQTHHPEWFRRNPDGAFRSPGAWGVVWEDLVELDYAKPALREAMAEVFLFWCRQGVDGFRCDAGYMIPQAAWERITARVRQEFPDTVFLLEGLGGSLDTTASLVRHGGLDWAYSELFQTYDRRTFEGMFPWMRALSEGSGPLIHFAETHDNNRLAATSPAFSRLRVAVAALLSQQGAFGITAGVEWFAAEKIDVHGCGGLNWGAPANQCAWIRRLNTLLRTHPLFGPQTHLEAVQEGAGNVLAVVRRRKGFSPLLVLLNLDWEHAQQVSFREEAFPARQAMDLLGSGMRALDPAGTPLAPGEALCLTAAPEEAQRLEAACAVHGAAPVAGLLARLRRVMALKALQWLGDPLPLDEAPEALATRFAQDPVGFTAGKDKAPRATTFRLPEDHRRTVPVWPGALLYAEAPFPFRGSLREPDGRVRATGQAVAMANGAYGLMLPVPKDSPALAFQSEMYTQEGVRRGESALCLLEGEAQRALVRRTYSGEDVRALGTACTLLTNGTGAMGQVRLRWGDLRSQYDCLLALNRHPTVPSDRQVFFTRCRIWVQAEGFSTPLDADCLDRVVVSPDGSCAEWHFAAPCGMGRGTGIALRAALEPGGDRVALRLRREAAPAPWQEVEGAVQLVLRPDVEWRNFHCKTKAYAGPEHQWPAAISDAPDGFFFSPERDVHLSMKLPGAEWRREPEWTYNVAHEEERARGQEPCGDLWSPGWFRLSLDRDASATLVAGEHASRALRCPALAAELPETPLPLREAMAQALRAYIVRRDAHKTVIAGYPWFLDWGRDTLIFLRGAAAAGDWETVFDALAEFGRFERGGTLPNMIRGEDDANRETVDAPLWFAVVCDDAIAAFGAQRVLSHPCGDRTVRDVLVSIAEHYVKGTENGIHADPETGLVWAPAHYTWMDTNYPAGTPRNGYAVEVQALWVRLLDLLGREVAPKWARLASKVRRNVRALFPLPQGGLSDCLYAAQGVGARQAEQDDAIRPNQLYAVTLGLLRRDRALAESVLAATECLLLPGAIRTLADRPVRRALPIVRDGVLLNDPHRPYWGRYEGDEDTRRKPAYHNGTGWTFPFPLYAEAAFLTRGEHARPSSLALLYSSEKLVNGGTVAHLPECVQGDAPHEPCGTGAQAWGVSELVRVLALLETPAT